MTRPAAPSYTVRTWATNANHPAGSDPWSSQPTKVEPPSPAGGFVPGQGAAAEYINKLIYDAYTQDASGKSYVGEVIDWTGQTPALNFPISVTATQLRTAKYIVGTRKWIGWSVTDNDSFRSQADAFVTWPASTDISGGALATLPTSDADGNAAGHYVVVCDTFDTYQEYNGSAWASHTGLFGNDTDRPSVSWDPVANLWCAASKRDGTGDPIMVATSSNRTTWTSRTAPAFPIDTFVALGTDGAGVTVLQGFNGTNTYFSRSTDGGITWSTPVTFALGFTADMTSGLVTLPWPKPVWTGTRWIAIAPGLPTTDTKVYTSTDGATWTLKATITSVAFKSVAGIGELLAALTTNNEIAVSTDAGATWFVTDRKFSAGVSSIAANGSRFLVCGVTAVYPGDAMGHGVSVLT